MAALIKLDHYDFIYSKARLLLTILLIGTLMACEDQITTQDLENAKQDATFLAEIANSRDGGESTGTLIDESTNRFGETTDTVTGRLKKMGYAVPIVYAGGITFTVNDNVKTVDESDTVYAPLPSALPFTTSGTWVGDDANKFFVVQGVTQDQLINDASQDYTFPTVALMEASTIEFPESKRLKTIVNNTTSNKGGASYVVRSGVSPNIGSPGIFGSKYAELQQGHVVDVMKWGCTGDNVEDDQPTIQAAEDYARVLRRKVWFPTPAVGYRINRPLVANTFTDWEGESESIYIFKHGNVTSGLPNRLIPAGGGATDTMDVDAVLIADHADNAYASYVKIKNLYFRNQTTNATTVDFDIFSPRMNYFHFENVSCRGAAVAGWRWFDAFQGEIECMFIAEADKGFNAEADGLSSGSGTSLTFIRPYTQDCGRGYDLYGMAYSTFVSPACDSATEIGYRFIQCNSVTLTSLGIEIITTATESIISVNSNITITGVKENGNNPTSNKLSISGGKVTLMNATFADYADPAGRSNLAISNNGQLVTINSTFPTNGSSFISYSNNSSWSEIKDGELTFRTSGNESMINSQTPLPAYKVTAESITSSAGAPGALNTGLDRQPQNVTVELTAGVSDTLPAVIPVCTLASNGGSLFIRFLNYSGAEVSGTYNVDVIAY